MDVGQAGPKVSMVPVKHPLGVGGSGLMQAQRVNHPILPFLVGGGGDVAWAEDHPAPPEASCLGGKEPTLSTHSPELGGDPEAALTAVPVAA